MAAKFMVIVSLVAAVRGSGQKGDYSSFSYKVFSPHTGDIKSHQETRNSGKVVGQYSLLEADGSHRIVDYTADGHSGFNAIVSTNPAKQNIGNAAKITHSTLATPVTKTSSYSLAPSNLNNIAHSEKKQSHVASGKTVASYVTPARYLKHNTAVNDTNSLNNPSVTPKSSTFSVSIIHRKYNGNDATTATQNRVGAAPRSDIFNPHNIYLSNSFPNSGSPSSFSSGPINPSAYAEPTYDTNFNVNPHRVPRGYSVTPNWATSTNFVSMVHGAVHPVHYTPMIPDSKVNIASPATNPNFLSHAAISGKTSSDANTPQKTGHADANSYTHSTSPTAIFSYTAAPVNSFTGPSLIHSNNALGVLGRTVHDFTSNTLPALAHSSEIPAPSYSVYSSQNRHHNRDYNAPLIKMYTDFMQPNFAIPPTHSTSTIPYPSSLNNHGIPKPIFSIPSHVVQGYQGTHSNAPQTYSTGVDNSHTNVINYHELSSRAHDAVAGHQGYPNLPSSRDVFEHGHDARRLW